MTIETVDGRAVFLRRSGNSWQVRWGKTIIASCRTWQEAVDEIMKLMGAGRK